MVSIEDNYFDIKHNVLKINGVVSLEFLYNIIDKILYRDQKTYPARTKAYFDKHKIYIQKLEYEEILLPAENIMGWVVNEEKKNKKQDEKVEIPEFTTHERNI